MKHLVKCFLLVFLFTSPVLLNASVTYNVNYNTSDLSFETKNDSFDLVTLKNTSLMNEVGKPQLPVKYLHLIIPQGTEGDSVVVNVNSSQSLKGEYKVFPAQPIIPPYKDTNFIPPDTTIYNSDSPFPPKAAKLIRTGSFSGSRIALVAVYPIRYIPNSEVLELYTSITVNVVTKLSNKTVAKPKKRTIGQYTRYKKGLYSIVDNDELIPSYSYKPTIMPGPKPTTKEQRIAPPMYPYMIITADSLEGAFSPLMVNKKGCSSMYSQCKPDNSGIS